MREREKINGLSWYNTATGFKKTVFKFPPKTRQPFLRHAVNTFYRIQKQMKIFLVFTL